MKYGTVRPTGRVWHREGWAVVFLVSETSQWSLAGIPNSKGHPVPSNRGSEPSVLASPVSPDCETSVVVCLRWASDAGLAHPGN